MSGEAQPTGNIPSLIAVGVQAMRLQKVQQVREAGLVDETISIVDSRPASRAPTHFARVPQQQHKRQAATRKAAHKMPAPSPGQAATFTTRWTPERTPPMSGDANGACGCRRRDPRN